MGNVPQGIQSSTSQGIKMSFAALEKALLDAVGSNDIQTEPKHWLDMGYPPLNHILSGRYDRGLPSGRIIEIYGPSASGKTLLATQAMIAAQKAGGIAIFIDWERAFNAKFAEELGLDTTFPKFIYKRSKTWEEGNTAAMKVAETVRKGKHIAEDAPIVVVFDSVAAAVPKSMAEKEIDEYTMNDTTALARVSSTTLKSVNQHVGEFEVTAIYLNQIRTKPGVVYGDPTTTPGGVAMEFYASVRIALGAKKIMGKDAAGDKEFLGRLIGMETKKNKVSRPFQSTDLRLVYDEEGRAHFDKTLGMLEHLVAIGKLEEKGGRIIWIDGKSFFKSVLSKQIDDTGTQAELVKLLPV
jgi:protein RecA